MTFTEFMQEECGASYELRDILYNLESEEILQSVISFTQMKVKEALEEAYLSASLIEKSEDEDGNQPCFCANDYSASFILDKESIMNAYPLSNIK